MKIFCIFVMKNRGGVQKENRFPFSLRGSGASFPSGSS